MNAIKTGIWAEKILLSGESPEEFSELARGVAEVLKPVGSFESALVELIVAKTWRLRRFQKIEAGILNIYQFYKGREGGIAVGFAHDATQAACCERISRCETSLERGLSRLLAQLGALQAHRLGTSGRATLDISATAVLTDRQDAKPSTMDGVPQTATANAHRFSHVLGLGRSFCQRLFKTRGVGNS